MNFGNERGMVLILVLVVVALLSALLSEFAFSTLIDLRLTETFRDTTRAEYLARGGIAAGRKILDMDRNSYDAKDGSELWSVGVQSYPLAEGAISVTIEDLGGRLNLNKLAQGMNHNSVYYQRFVSLCTELGLDNPDALADALTDWIDTDQTPEPGGAEDAYYRAENPPYEATDGPLTSLEELRLIRGFDAETYNKLKPFVYVTSSGGDTLNVNTASPELLRSWDIDFSPTDVETLVTARDKGPFKTIAELETTLGASLPNSPYSKLTRNGDIGITSNFFLISSQGQVNDGARRMEAIVQRPQLGRTTLLWQKVN